MSCKCENEQKYEWAFKTLDDNSSGLEKTISLVIASMQEEGWEYVHDPKFIWRGGSVITAILAFRRKNSNGANSDVYHGA